MKTEALHFLKKYSSSIDDVNRILVSSFIKSNEIYNVQNEYINQFIIKSEDADYDTFLKFELECEYEIYSFDDLIRAFEFVISPSDKIVTGAVYTPEAIRDVIIDDLFVDETGGFKSTICDPACGCGGFLYSAAKKTKKN